MSDTLTDNFDLEGDLWRKRLIAQIAGRQAQPNATGADVPNIAANIAQGVPIGLLAGAAPLEGGYHIPGGGFAANMYGAISGITDLAARHVLGMQSGKLPGGDAANEAWRNNVEWAAPKVTVLPEPTTPAQAIAREVGTMIGGAGPVGTVRTGMTVPDIITSVLAPNTMGAKAAAINTGIAAAGGLYAAGEANAAQQNQNGAQGEQLPVPPIPPVANSTIPVTQLPPQPAQPASPDVNAPVPSPVEAPAWKIPFTDRGVTWGEAAIVGATGLALLASRGRIAEFIAARNGETVAARNARLFANEAEVQAFNERVRATPPVGTTPPVGEAPLPGSAGSATVELQRQTVNQNAVLNAYVRETMGDTNMPSGINLADEIRARAGVNRMMNDGTIREMARTGYDPVSGMKMPSLQWDIEAPIAKMAPDVRQLYNQTRHYANELDNRVRLGSQVTDFPTMSTAELRMAVNQGMQSPEIRYAIDASRNLHDAMINIGVKRGYFTPQEASNLIARHRNFMPSYTESTGLIDNPFTPRDIGVSGGLRGISADVTNLDRQHFKAFFEQLERNDMQRFVINNMLDYQRNNPGTAQLIREWKPARTPQAGKIENWPPEVIAYRDGGVPKYVRVENRAIREALTGSELRGNVLLGAMSGIFREFTTGPMSTLATGGFFPAVSAIRGATQLATNTVGRKGPLDAIIRSATGERIGLPSDPTAALSTVSHAVRGIGAVGAQHISDALRANSQSAMGQTIRRIMGDKATNAMSIRAQMAYNRSWLAQYRAEGLAHSAGMASELTPGVNNATMLNATGRQQMIRRWMGQASEQYNTLNRMTPEISLAHQWGGIAPWSVRMRTLVDDIFGAVSESGHQAFYALNKKNPNLSPAQLRYETAQLTGHPGTRGASPKSYQVDNAIPFWNITKQGIARFARQYNENPVAAAAAHTSLLGTMAAGTILTALHAGPEAVNHLINSLTSDQQAEGPRFYFSGQPGTSAPSISLEQTHRPVYAALLSMMVDVLGLSSLNTTSPDYSGMDMLRRFMSKYIATDSFERVLAGVSAAGPQASVPAIQAIGAIGGSVPDINLRSGYRLLEGVADSGRGQDMTAKQAFFNPTGSSLRTPGMPTGVTSITGDTNGDAMEALLQATIGASAAPLVNLYKVMHGNLRAGQSWGDAFDAGMIEYRQQAQDKSTITRGLLFPDAQSKLARRTQVVDRVQEMLAGMKPTATAGSGARNAGFTGSRPGAALSIVPGEGSAPTDPVMFDMYATVGRMYNRLQRGPIAAINDITKSQAGALVAGLPGEYRRMDHNAMEQRVQRIYSDVAWELSDLQKYLSQKHGIQFDLRTVDWRKGPEQFRPLLPN